VRPLHPKEVLEVDQEDLVANHSHQLTSFYSQYTSVT